ncbi:MAG: HAD family hydrolase [Pseudomonadota bacterium]
MKIAMWSGPRNLSTALMYSFAARGDCAVWDEPFYAAYLQATGIDHPMRDAVIAVGEVDAARVAARCLMPAPDNKTIYYQKHMTLHMIPEFDLGFMRGLTNVFLIRHPARVIASYAKKREAPTLHDIGFVQQARLFDQVADWMGQAPLVVDSADIRINPQKSLMNICSTLGISYSGKMLRWPMGPKPYDGVWAPHWYNAVHDSTGFDAPEGNLPDLPHAYRPLLDAALPYYRKLAQHAASTGAEST